MLLHHPCPHLTCSCHFGKPAEEEEGEEVKSMNGTAWRLVLQFLQTGKQSNHIISPKLLVLVENYLGVFVEQQEGGCLIIHVLFDQGNIITISLLIS